MDRFIAKQLHVYSGTIQFSRFFFFYTKNCREVKIVHIFKQNNIGSVFHALAQAGIDVRDSEGACITEDILARQSPFNYNAHLLLIDALMTAHLRSIVSIEKVVQAIS
jgi:hypothetical protein